MTVTPKILGGSTITEADPMPVVAEATASAPAVASASDIDPIPRGIHVSVAGDVVGFLEDDDTGGTARTFTVLAGMYYPYRFRRITALNGGAVAVLLS